jgi:hypothetical protein
MLVDAGEVCAVFHDEKVRGVKAKRVQCDEIWSFTYSKQKNVAKAKAAPAHAGDTWTWTGIEAESKLIVSYMVGGRDSEYAMAFIWRSTVSPRQPRSTHHGRSQSLFGCG